MSSNGRIRILSVDNHPLMREGIATLINGQPDMQLVAQASNGREAVEYFCECKPDITLMDLRLPDMSGTDVMLAIREKCFEARIIIFTSYEGDFEIQRALAAGARSYTFKNMPPGDIVDVIRKVWAGKKCIPPAVAMQLVEHLSDEPLTEREIDVLRRVSAGNSNKIIAADLALSEQTVKGHLRTIFSKLGANDRTHAVTIALHRGLIHV